MHRGSRRLDSATAALSTSGICYSKLWFTRRRWRRDPRACVPFLLSWCPHLHQSRSVRPSLYPLLPRFLGHVPLRPPATRVLVCACPRRLQPFVDLLRSSVPQNTHTHTHTESKTWQQLCLLCDALARQVGSRRQGLLILVVRYSAQYLNTLHDYAPRVSPLPPIKHWDWQRREGL